MASKSQMQTSANDVKDLFSQAQIDPNAQSILVANLNASAAALAACQGTDAINLGATEATIVVEVLDASSSMDEAEKDVAESINESITAMQETKESAAMTHTLITFNDQVKTVYANKPVEDIKKSDIVYKTNGSTALYDAVLDALTGALAYEEQLLTAGMTTKVNVVVYSDGANNASRHGTAAQIKKVAAEVLRRENWVLAFVGFDTFETRVNGVDYAKIAKDMGFPALLVIDLKEPDSYKRRHAIRETFRMTSKSIIRNSQTTINPNANPNSFFQTP